MLLQMIRRLRKDLTNHGERVDIDLSAGICDFESLDMYQRSHYRRYEFACSLLAPDMLVGDFASGTGYGTAMMSQVARHAYGCDMDPSAIKAAKKRYRSLDNLTFVQGDMLCLRALPSLDVVVSFETIEHFPEEVLPTLFGVFRRALVPAGRLILSTPYMQERSPQALKMGFHLTFEIDENRIQQWLSRSGFVVEAIRYQNYETHSIADRLDKKDFLVCISRKKQ